MKTLIDFKQPYTNSINEKATIKLMKEHLTFLSKNAFLLEEDSDDGGHYVEDEDNLIDYLNYSKSIIELHSSTTTMPQSTKLLNAIAKKDKESEERRRMRLERKLRCGWLLQGIMRLNEKEKMLLIYRYMQGRDFAFIQTAYQHLSQSSYYRLHNHACLHLASILDVEILSSKAHGKAHKA